MVRLIEYNGTLGMKMPIPIKQESVEYKMQLAKQESVEHKMQLAKQPQMNTVCS